MSPARRAPRPEPQDPSRPPAAGLSGRAYAIGLGGIVVVGFVVRLITLFTVAHHNPDGGDPFYYHVQANFIVHGHGFADPFIWQQRHEYVAAAVHPPLYTMWLAISSVLGGQGFFAHKVMSCIAGTITVLLIGLIGREVASRRAGLIAAGLAALYPPLWVIDGLLWPEGLFTATIAASIYCAYRWRRSPRWHWAAALGVAIALAALTRGEAAMLVVILALPLFLTRKGLRGRMKATSTVASLLAFAIVIAPWMGRNLVTFNDFVPLSTNGNEVLVYANNPYAYGTARREYACVNPAHSPSQIRLGPTGNTFIGFWFFPWQNYLRCRNGEPPGDASQKAHYWQNQGIDYAKAHPRRLVLVSGARVGRIWDFYAPFQNGLFSQVEGRARWVSTLGLWCYWLLLPVAIAGLVVLKRRRVTIFPLVIQAAVITLVALYAYGSERFRTPVDVAILVAAAVAFDAVIRRVWPGRTEPSPQEVLAPTGPAPAPSANLGGETRGWTTSGDDEANLRATSSTNGEER